MKRSEKVAAAYAKFADAQAFLRGAQARETNGNTTLIAEKIIAEYDGHARVARHAGTPVDPYFRPTAEDTAAIEYSAAWLKTAVETVRLARLHVVLRVKLPAYLEQAIKSCDATLARFQERFASNPADALSWGADAFTAAARREIQTKLLNFLRSDRALALDDTALVDIVKGHAQDDLMHRAGSSSRSTSPTSNIMEDELRVAAARLWEMLKDLETGWMGSL